MTTRPRVLVMGVTGAGKSTVGRLVADALGVPFLDADDFHDDDAIARMRAGVPLTEEERRPWLERLNRALRDHAGSGFVLACSALTAASRAWLTDGVDGVRYVLLTADPETIEQRVARRSGHFAGPGLVPSQFSTLEPPPGAIVVDVRASPEEVAATALTGLTRRRGTS